MLQLSLCAVIVGCGPIGENDPTGTVSHQLLSGPLTIAPTGGFGDPGTTTTIDAAGNVNWVGGAWYVPLGLQAGDVVGSVSVVVRDNGASNGHASDGNNVLAMLVSRTAAGDTTRGFASSSGSGLQQTLSVTPTGGSYAVQAGDEMLLKTTGLKGGAIPGPSTVPSMTGPVIVAPRSASASVPVPFSAGWRLQWNSGSPVASVHSIQAPAGVQIGLVPIGLKGAAELYVSSASLDTGTVAITASHGTGQDFTDRFSIGLQSPLGSGGTGNPVVIATADMVAAAARATPPVTLSVGQRFLYARIVSRFVAQNGTSNQTDPSLEDAVIRAVGTLTGPVVPAPVSVLAATPRTMPIPVLTSSNSAYRQPIVAGLGFSAFIPADVGSTITAVRLSMQDTTTSYSLQVRDGAWGDFLALDAASSPSTGGSKQILTIATSIRVLAGHSYEINLDNTSTGSLFVYGAECDVQ